MPMVRGSASLASFARFASRLAMSDRTPRQRRSSRALLPSCRWRTPSRAGSTSRAGACRRRPPSSTAGCSSRRRCRRAPPWASAPSSTPAGNPRAARGRTAPWCTRGSSSCTPRRSAAPGSRPGLSADGVPTDDGAWAALRACACTGATATRVTSAASRPGKVNRRGMSKRVGGRRETRLYERIRRRRMER